MDLPGFDAAGANIHALGGGSHLNADALNVGIPTALCAAMGVAEAHAEDGFFVADFTNGGHAVLSCRSWKRDGCAVGPLGDSFSSSHGIT